jgi:hypothetical protein
MFIANLNVFIAVLTGASYVLGWLLDTPVSKIGPHYGTGLMVALMILTAILVAVWATWGLTPIRGLMHQRLYIVGQFGITISSTIFVGGIAMSLLEASISIENEYWCWALMLDRIGPVGSIFFAASMGLIFAAHVVGPSTAKPTEVAG